jgi:two-component system, chemotaxis family, response regulator Rcp1
MLILNLDCLSEGELAEEAAGHCAQFGAIKSITVHKPADQVDYAVALVSMATARATHDVLEAFGDSTFGATVVIRLEQESMPIPVSLKLLADADLDAQMYDMRSCVSHLPAAAPAAEPAAPAPLELLLVEDDPADVRMTREALQAAGIPCRLHVVEDGMSAISFLCRTRQFSAAPKPDIIVLDLNIPKINGHEVLAEIKSNDSLKHIPVVVLTCSKSAGDMRKSYRMNADRFMTKAMGLDTYVEQIKSIAALAVH